MVKREFAVLLAIGVARAYCPSEDFAAGNRYAEPDAYMVLNASSDAGRCCNSCGLDTRCRAWTFVLPAECRLFASAPTRTVPDASSTSGAAPPPAPAPSPVPANPARLRINGSTILDDIGTPIRLTGFNWQLGRTRAGEGAYMRSVMPNANVARVVGIIWDNDDGDTHGPRGRAELGDQVITADCMTDSPPYFFDETCFRALDATIRDATSAGVWVIVAVRSKYGAGQDFESNPQSDVFHNATLRAQLYAMWGHVAAHYRAFDRIAAYEILAEPRDKAVDPSLVRSFYEGGCAAAAAADSRTPCMVGGRPYYKLWTFDESVILQGRPPNSVIYTVDYFEPDGFGSSKIPAYGPTYPCKTLCKGWVSQCCPNGTSLGGGDARANVAFDASWSASNFERFALPVRAKFHVPIFVNQWSVPYGVARSGGGRYEFMADLALTLKRFNMGWAWWTWRGGGDTDWKNGSTEIVYDYSNGSVGVDMRAIQALSPGMLP